MSYADWQRARADICLLLHEQMMSGRLGFARDFSMVFQQPYHQFLEESPSEPDLLFFQRGALLMLLNMALADIQDHVCDYGEVYTEPCAAAVRVFASADEVTQRLGEVVRLAFRVIQESTFHTRAEHPEYWSLESQLNWVFEAVVVDYYRSMLHRGRT
jgi:hypothetical protein